MCVNLNWTGNALQEVKLEWKENKCTKLQFHHILIVLPLIQIQINQSLDCLYLL